MKHSTLFLICLSTSLLTTNVIAAESTADPDAVVSTLPPGFSGAITLGFSSSKGNTDNNDINGGFTLNYGMPKWEHVFTANFDEGEFNDAKTSERYTSSYAASYLLDSKSYLFGIIDFEKDKFTNIDSRTGQLVGYGRPALFKSQNKKHTIGTEIGIGASQAKFTNTRPDEDQPGLYFKLDYTGKFNERMTFTESFSVFAGDDSSYGGFETSLNVPLTDKTSLKLTHNLRHDTGATAGVKKTDSDTSVNIVVGF